MLTFEEVIRKPQYSLKKALIAELSKRGYQTQAKKGFIYAKGSLPVMLVAHLDTVHKKAVQTICYSADRSIVMSPEGIGGDDRAGVYMILSLIKKYRCHILFCEDEEIGCIGAHKFAGSGIKPEVNYIVELDRHGANDAVFYDCDNPEFTRFVVGFGFKMKYGSFSDISVIAPELKVAAVNISAGYYNEHRKHEYIDLRVIDKNIELIGKMISTPAKKFSYIESLCLHNGFWNWRYDDLFGYTEQVNDCVVKELFPLPDTAYITMTNGYIKECNGQYLLDSAGNVYEFIYDIGVAVKMDGLKACSEHGLSVRFQKQYAMDFEVMPMERMFDAYSD